MKKRVVLSGIFYPVAILRYFESALRARDDIEFITVGVDTKTWIPWQNGMNLPDKYAISPDVPLNENLWRIGKMTAASFYANPELEDIDLWIQCDAGFYFSDRPPAKKVAHIATDPHVLDYSAQRGLSDWFFNMQDFYSRPGDLYLPYAASKYHHYQEEREKEYDVCLVGLNYNSRTQLVNMLKARGISAHYTIGLGMDEYREAYNKSRVAFSWSSMNDLIARVFEAGAMKLPLATNFVPDLPAHFTDGEDLMVFHSAEQACNQIERLLSDEELSNSLVESFYDKITKNYYYDHRIDRIFETVNL